MSSSNSSLLKVLCCALTFTLTACEQNQSSESAPADPITEAVQSGSLNVDLSEVSETKCLNLEKYFTKIQSFPRETRIRKIATDFRLLSGNSLPKNFYYRLVAGNFQVNDVTLSETPDFPVMKQEGCKSVTFAEEGYSQSYEIIAGKKDSVTYKNEWGGQTTVTWISPMSVEFDHASTVTDDLCDNGSKGRILVTHRINWGDQNIFQENIPADSISQNFLNLVTNAKGTSLNGLYTSPVFVEPPVLGPEIPDKPQYPDNPQTPANPPAPIAPEVPESPATPVAPELPPGDEVIAPVWADIDDLQPVDSGRQLLVSRLKQLQSMPVRSDLLQCY